MRHMTILSMLFVTVLGCAALNQPTIQIEPSQLSSITNPQLVDGNLETVGTFNVNGRCREKIPHILRRKRTTQK